MMNVGVPWRQVTSNKWDPIESSDMKYDPYLDLSFSSDSQDPGLLELSPNIHEGSPCPEKASTSAISMLKAPTSIFTFMNIYTLHLKL